MTNKELMEMITPRDPAINSCNDAIKFLQSRWSCYTGEIDMPPALSESFNHEIDPLFATCKPSDPYVVKCIEDLVIRHLQIKAIQKNIAAAKQQAETTEQMQYFMDGILHIATWLGVSIIGLALVYVIFGVIL